MTPYLTADRIWGAPCWVSMLCLVLVVLASFGTPAHARDTPAPSAMGNDPASVAPSAATGAAPIPLAPCSGNASSFFVVFNLTSPSVMSNATGYDIPAVGPVPINLSFNLTISGPQTVFYYSIYWGDVSSTVNSFVNKTIPGSVVVPLTHDYVLPALYNPSANVNWSCPQLGGGGAGAGTQIEVFGPAGPAPATVTANATAGAVPLNVTYTATIAGAPTNATALWQLMRPNLTETRFFQTSANLTTSVLALELTVPGTYNGELSIFYPGNATLYFALLLPPVIVQPLVWLHVAHTAIAGDSPWNLTLWGNVTTLGNQPYNGSYTVLWSFPTWGSFGNGTGSPYFWTTGPTVGSPIWQEFFDNVSFPIVLLAQTSVVRADGVAIAFNLTRLAFTPTAGVPPLLQLVPSITSGPAPLNFTLAVQLIGAGNQTFSNVDLHLTAWRQGTIAWTDDWPNWTGVLLQMPEWLVLPGTYFIDAQAFDNGSGGWGTVSANVTMIATGNSGGGGPTAPTLTFAATPSSGTAPLNVSLSLVAVGGTSPYDLTVCTMGPFSLPNGTGSCALAASSSSWDGSGLAASLTLTTAGNYTIVAAVTDAGGSATTARASELVLNPGPAVPLTAHASYVAPAAVTSTGATYGFETSVSGGVAPYIIQWSFGDGAVGSGASGLTTPHTYTRSGTFDATLTVTDARGATSSASVGPLVVVLPIGPGSALPWWASSWALGIAAAIGVASAVALGVSAQRSAERKAALKWFRDLEEPKAPDRPDEERP